jgi:hypothetical protein
MEVREGNEMGKRVQKRKMKGAREVRIRKKEN